MGAMAEAIVAYAQPLLEGTDGTLDSMNRAMAIAQVCWNVALMPEDRREAAIDDLKPGLKMTDAEFAEFRQHVIRPMIQRHHEMFPGMNTLSPPTAKTVAAPSSPAGKPPGTGRNAPCPCGSGRKYKHCCGARK